RVADKFALLRSMHHESNGHVNSTHTLLSAYPGEVVEKPPFRPTHPDVWSVANKFLGAKTPGVPPWIALPRFRYNGSAYLGTGLDPLVINSDQSKPTYRPPRLAIDEALRPRFLARQNLVKQFDAM